MKCINCESIHYNKSGFCSEDCVEKYKVRKENWARNHVSDLIKRLKGYKVEGHIKCGICLKKFTPAFAYQIYCDSDCKAIAARGQEGKNIEESIRARRELVKRETVLQKILCGLGRNHAKSRKASKNIT